MIIALALLGWLCGWLLFAGFRSHRAAPPGRGASRRLSIIIPARDEENNLPRLLQSLPQNVPEVIVVDDCSRDGTRAVAMAYGARVIDGTPPPRGWLGKNWACQHGAEVATGDRLLFLDADVWPERDAMASLTNDCDARALSIAPYQHVPTMCEQFSAFFHLLMLAGAGPRHLLGQSLLIDRETYRELGEHAAVKDQVLENFALAQKMRASARTLLGRGLLNIRMYAGGWREMIDGWSKSFANGAAGTSRLRLFLSVVWLAGCVLAVAHVATYALVVLQLAVLLRRIGTYRLVTALLYPLPLLFFFVVFARSVFRTRTNESMAWKGRPVRVA